MNPALVLPDKEGKPLSVRYDAVNAMLLNEILKNTSKTAGITSNRCAAGEKFSEPTDGAAKANRSSGSDLQKVSAQIEISSPAPQTVMNNCLNNESIRAKP